MTLQAAYTQFLAAPNPAFLATEATLHYITTLTTVSGTSEIIKHLSTQSHQLKKKEEKVLDAVEAPNALAVEVETTIEFLTSGGAYLPGLDDNFLADRVVTFPVVCCDPFLVVLTELSLIMNMADPHRQLRQQRQDPAGSAELGPGFAPETH